MTTSPHLLIVNSNTSEATTTQVAEAARRLAPEVEITAVTAAYGPRGIGGRTDLVISSLATVEAALAAGPGYDAVVIACFSDPGLAALRELLDVPVVGIGEASFLTAAMLGARFSVVTPGARVAPIVEEAVRLTGLDSRFAGVTLVDSAVIQAVDKRSLLLDGVRRAVAEQGAEVAILGGAAFAGLAAAIGEESPIPVVGSVEAAVAQALALIRLAPRKAGTGSYSRPALKPMLALPPLLAARLSGTAP